MKKRILFIINPISGVGKKGKLPILIDKYIDHSLFDYEIAYTEYQKHAKEIGKEAVLNKIDIVCVAGGDGSINEVGSVLVDSTTALGIIPSGSGNGIARHLKIPMNFKRAIEKMNKSEITKLDVFQLNDKIGIGFAGLGVDATIAKKFNKIGKRGVFNYAKLVVSEFIQYKGIKVTIDNQKTIDNLLFCSIANTSQFGNNFYISPKSNHNDGQIELVFIKKRHFFSLIYLLILSFLKQIHNSKRVKIISVKKVSLTVNNSEVNIDGESVFFENKNIEIECKPQSLRVVI